jgi:hypothetical protein
MRLKWQSLRLFFLTTASMMVIGCRQYVPVVVRVEDAQTGQPIADARVNNSYTVANIDPWNQPRFSVDTTDANGIARIWLTPDIEALVAQGANVRAKGYRQGGAEITRELLRRLCRKDGHRGSEAKPVQSDVVVRLTPESN